MTSSGETQLSRASAGTWTATLGGGCPAGALLVRAEPGWPAPQVAELPLCTVVFDGTLYEQASLPKASVRGAPIGEAELVANAFLVLGRKLFPRLRGRFSLIVWDARSSTFYCVRDPSGIHPLFYAQRDRDVLVSPSVDVLIRDPGVIPAVDPVVAAGFILDLSPAPEETLFSTVRRIPAGHLLRVRQRVESLEQYWSPDYDRDLPGTREDLSDEFQVLMRQAVRRCSDAGPVGVFLSGGLDSTCVAVTAAEVSHELHLPAPRALSLTFPGLAADEALTQRRVTSALGLPNLLASPDDLVGRGRLLQASLELAGSTASPPDLLQPAYDALALDARRHGCKVILSGDGGDEWLLPPPEYAADRMLAFDVPALYRLARAWSSYWPVGMGAATRSVLWRRGARSLLRAGAGRALSRWLPRTFGRGRRARLTPWFPAWVAPGAELRRDVVEWAIANSSEPRTTELYDEAKRSLLAHPRMSMLLEELFAMRRRLGLPVLTPLLDADLLAFLYRAPPSLLIDGGRAKALAREVIARHLPFADEWPRTVYGEDIWQSSLRAEATDALRSLGGLTTLADLGVVEAGAPVGMMHPRGAPLAPTQAIPVWEALRLEAWLKLRVD